MKPVALSHLFSDCMSVNPVTILPIPCTVGTAVGSLGDREIVKEAQHSQPHPGIGPINCLFVSEVNRTCVNGDLMTC